jgi:hypothetical protein
LWETARRQLCKPYLHLQELTRPGIIRHLLDRPGINADIVSDGVIAIGDAVTRVEPGG